MHSIGTAAFAADDRQEHHERLTPLGRPQSKKRAASARLSQQVRCRVSYAACLCIAPEVEPLPRIALIERSIADHSRLISDAARPSE